MLLKNAMNYSHHMAKQKAGPAASTADPAAQRNQERIPMNRIKSIVAASVAVLLSLGALSAVWNYLTPAPTAAVPAVVQTADPTPPPPITVAAVGDSITAWVGDSPVKNTWPKDLSSGPVVVDYTQGWAVSGTRIADMAAGLKVTTADYLVVMGGVNDRAWPTTPYSQMEASLGQIVAESGVPADHVIVSAIAPVRGFLPFVNGWNADEQAMAAQNGWNYINPWDALKGADGNYLPEDTIDGTHPTDTGEVIVANVIAADVLFLHNGHRFVTLPAPMIDSATPAPVPAVVKATMPVIPDGDSTATGRLIQSGRIR